MSMYNYILKAFYFPLKESDMFDLEITTSPILT